MISDRVYRLTRIFYEIIEYLKSLHLDESHWLRLGIFTDGSFFKDDLSKQSLDFLLEVGIKIELEVHPSGRSIRDCYEVDCLAQIVSIRAWYHEQQDPCTYKWEYGSPTKLKKDDEDWHDDVALLESIEIVLEDIVKSMK